MKVKVYRRLCTCRYNLICNRELLHGFHCSRANPRVELNSCLWSREYVSLERGHALVTRRSTTNSQKNFLEIQGCSKSEDSEHFHRCLKEILVEQEKARPQNVIQTKIAIHLCVVPLALVLPYLHYICLMRM